MGDKTCDTQNVMHVAEEPKSNDFESSERFSNIYGLIFEFEIEFFPMRRRDEYTGTICYNMDSEKFPCPNLKTKSILPKVAFFFSIKISHK